MSSPRHALRSPAYQTLTGVLYLVIVVSVAVIVTVLLSR